MKKIILTAASISLTVSSSLLSLIPPAPVAAPAFVILAIPAGEAEAEAPSEPSQEPRHEEIVPKTASGTIRALISAYAKKYGVSESLMLFTVVCEAGIEMDPAIQSGHFYPRDFPEWGVKKGDRELSFGLAQIHLPSNTGITKAQATDPDFALNFLAAALSRGEKWRWNCLK